MNRIRWSLIAALLVAGALASTASADHSWGSYHWARTTTSFDLLVIDSVTSGWQAAFDQTLVQWSTSSKLNLVEGAVDESNRSRMRCQAVVGQMRVCNAAYGQNGWIGLAMINLDSNGHITRGTAKMNDSYGWYYAQVPGEDNHVMCQETGHVLGLDHTSEDGSSQGSCMDYSTSLASQWPNAHDFGEFETIYAHSDAYDSYDTGSGGGGSGGSCTAPPGKGCNKHEAPSGVPSDAVLIHSRAGRDGNPGHAVFALPDDEGGSWLYHVTLVPENARRR